MIPKKQIMYTAEKETVVFNPDDAVMLGSKANIFEAKSKLEKGRNLNHKLRCFLLWWTASEPAPNRIKPE
jgi:hypothetical protein